MVRQDNWALAGNKDLKRPSMVRTDTRVAVAVVGFYFILAAALLPRSEYARALGLSAVTFAAVALVADRLGRGPIPGLSLMAVAFAAAAVLWVPTFPAMGGTSRQAVPVGFLGMQAAAILYAALRWQAPAQAPSKTSLRSAWTFGIIAATGISVVATIPIVLGVLSPGPFDLRFLWVYAGYYAGLLAAATCYWLLQRIAHLATGRYLIGVLGGTSLYLAVSPVFAMSNGEPLLSAKTLIVAAIAGGLVGPAVALSDNGANAQLPAGTDDTDRAPAS